MRAKKKKKRALEFQRRVRMFQVKVMWETMDPSWNLNNLSGDEQE